MSQKKVSGIIYSVLLAICLVVLGYLLGSGHGTKQVQVITGTSPHIRHSATAAAHKSGGNSNMAAIVDLNTVDQVQLETLPGIGPTLAERIISYRESIGKFETKEQLLEIPGIGQAKYEQIADLVTVGG